MRANIIDTLDAAIDEFVAEGGTIPEWQALSAPERGSRQGRLMEINEREGYWFYWSDGTVRDWPEA